MIKLRMLWGLLLYCCIGVAAQNGTTLRRPISPSQPAWIIHIDVWNYADPQKIIDMVPEDVRPFVIFNISTSSTDRLQPSGPAIYDSWLKVCAQNRVWTMIQCASGATNRMPDTPGDVSVYEHYFKNYPNFVGFNFAEQFWGFGSDGKPTFPERLQLFARLLELSKIYGGYLVASFTDSYYNASKMPIAWMKRNQDIREFLTNHPEHFLCFEKFTQKKNFLDIESNCLGQWLAGYAGQYGIRFDSSGWVTAQDQPDSEGNTRYTKGAVDFIRAAGAIPVAEHMMLTGQTIMDGPELITTESSTEGNTTIVDGYTRRNWQWFPHFKSISLDLFRKVLDGTIPIMTREEVIARTKVCLVNDKPVTDVNDETEKAAYITPERLYDGLYRHACDEGGRDNENHWLENRWWMKSTGRYPAIPQVLTAPAGMKEFRVSKYNKTEFDNWMKTNFEAEYSGNIFAGRYENGWVTYNPFQYNDVKDATGIRTLGKNTTRATGTIPFKYNTCSSIELDYAPYSLGIMKEYAQRITFYLSNYEGGKDIIKINGATAKPTYTKTDRGSETSTIEESWQNGVYTLSVTHRGGAVDLTIHCAGSQTDRLSAKDATPLTITPDLPPAYTGMLQYEAEVADYKSTTIRKSGYNQGRDNYQGQGFAELNNSSSALRFIIQAPQSGYYLLTLRYQADANASIKIGDETLTLAKTDAAWSTIQTIAHLNEGKGHIIFQNGSSQKVYVDNITLESIKAETFTPDENGNFHVTLSNLIASGTISIDATTGVVTQAVGGQNASGSLRLFLDHADFTKVTNLLVTYEGDGDIFKYLVVCDNYGNTANPTGSQGAFWSSKYNLDYTNYQQTVASQRVCKLEWTASAPLNEARTMTIKDILIKTKSATGIGNLPRTTTGIVRYYNLQGHPVEQPRHGVHIVKMQDGSYKKICF